MFSLSLRERILVMAILSAVLLGAAVKHWRDARRESLALLPAPAAQSAPAPVASRNSLSPSPHGQFHP